MNVSDRDTEYSTRTEASRVKHACNYENNVPFRLSPQWICENLFPGLRNVQLHIANSNVPKCAQQAEEAI